MGGVFQARKTAQNIKNIFAGLVKLYAVMILAHKYDRNVKKRGYKRLTDLVGERVVATETLELIANFSFIPKTQKIIKSKLSKWDINAHDFSIHFDGATFEYYPRQLKVTVYIYEHYYSFDFTKPQWLGQPLSKHTDAMLLGKAPK